MSDASRSETAHPLEPASDADRDAKIEQLLLVGLDHYFAAQYEQAINVWTRALFLDRSHPRARAYIERARSALAERQREFEELLQKGVTAFQHGDAVEARRLLRAAIDGGAPSDEALAVLDRLDRLEAGTAAAVPAPSRATRRSERGASSHRSRSVVGLVAAALLALGALAFGGYAAAARQRLARPMLRLFRDDRPANSATPVVPAQNLPLPRRGELTISRARALAAGGHLSDALALLEQVRDTDPQKSEAERLRADLQRQLLVLTPPGERHDP